MTTQAVFVDLPNFYSHLLESDIDDPRVLRDYFLHWFDFDRLSEKLTDEFSSVWVFYSGRKFGPKSNRVEDKFLDEYLERTNSLRGVTARDVDIEGKQRERATYQCECGRQGTMQWESEKGIDASLTVHLFDTMDTWETAYLLSGDADFVPVVASLRRRGKIVIGAGFLNRSTALVRECYDYIDLRDLFLQEDIFAYRIFAEDGIAKKWLIGEHLPTSDNGPVEFSFEWQFRPEQVVVYFIVKGDVNLENWTGQVDELRALFPGGIGELNENRREYQFLFPRAAWGGVERRVEIFISTLRGVGTYNAHYDGRGFSAKYEFNTNTQKYETV